MGLRITEFKVKECEPELDVSPGLHIPRDQL